MTHLTKHFTAIGARLQVRPLLQSPTFTLNILRDRRGEYFELRHGPEAPTLAIQHVDRPARHLLLVTTGAEAGQRFLCGHDERHWFVAGVADPVTTVRDAKLSLTPAALREAVARERHRDRRHNALFVRQGEWFFVPATLPPLDWKTKIFKHEPITRGRGKSHFCEELVRFGGVTVRLYQGREIDDAEFASLTATNPKLPYRTMVRDATVYVRGRIRHEDHATILLRDWHRVYLNAEFTTGRVTFYD